MKKSKMKGKKKASSRFDDEVEQQQTESLPVSFKNINEPNSDLFLEAPDLQSNIAPSKSSFQLKKKSATVPAPPPGPVPNFEAPTKIQFQPQRKAVLPVALEKKKRVFAAKKQAEPAYFSDDEDENENEEEDFLQEEYQLEEGDYESLGYAENFVKGTPSQLPFTAADLQKAKVKIGKAAESKEKKLPAVVDLTRVDLLRKLDSVITSHIPIHRMKDVAKTGLPGNMMKSKMSFYGIEQTTDMVIKVWLDNWTKEKSSNLISLMMHGCVNITDVAVEWIAEACPNLQTAIFSGCRNLTDRSLDVLLKKCTNLWYLSMVGTSVSSIPADAGRLKYLNLKGCPLHTPMKEQLEPREVDVVQFTSDYYSENKFTSYVAYKMVLTGVCGGKKSELANQMGLTYKEKGKMCSVHGNWTPKTKQSPNKQIVYNIMESDEKCVLDLFTSERCVYVITCDLNDSKAAEKCVEFIGSVLVQAVHVFFAIVATHEGKDESQKLKSLESQVLSLMDKWKKTLEEKKDVLENEPEKADFPAQLMYGRIQTLLTAKSHIEYYEVNPVSGQGMDKLHEGLSNLRDKIDETFPYLVKFSKEFVEEAENFLKVSTKTDKKIVPFTDYEFFFGGREQQMILRTANVHEKILETLHIMGKILYFKEVEDKPVIFDVEWFMKVINTLQDVRPGGDVKTLVEFGEKTPVLSQELIQQKLAGVAQSDQILDVVTLLQDLGLCLKLSYFRRIKSDEEKTQNIPVVLYSALESETPQILSHFWSTIPSNTEKRVQKSFVCDSGLPDRLRASIFEQCSIFGNVLLLWKNGILIQQGVLDLLIQVQDNGRIQLSCCTFNKDNLITAMHKTVNSLSIAISGIIWRFSPHITVVVNVACPSCVASDGDPQEFRLEKIIHTETPMQCAKCSQSHGKGDFLSPADTELHLIHELEIKKEEFHRWSINCTQLLQTLQTQENSAIVGGHYSQRNIKARKDIVECSHCGTSENGCAILNRLYHTAHKGHMVQTSCVSRDKFVKKEADRAQTGNIFNHVKNEPVRILTGFKMNPLGCDEFSVLVVNCLRNGNVEIGFNKNGSVHKCSVETGDILTCKLVLEKSSDSDDLITKVRYFKNFKKEKEEILVNGGDCVPYCQLTGNDKVTVMMHSSSIPVWSSVSLEFEPGMRLEALDVKNPTLTCVATVVEVNDQGQILIHFDGWGSNYDYWCEPTDKNLHPLGYCQHHKIRLQAPYNYRSTRSSQFSWSVYLEEVKSVAAPYDLFTQEQTRGSPPYMPELEGNFTHTAGLFAKSYKCDGTDPFMAAYMRNLGSQWKFLTEYWRKEVQNLNKQQENSHGSFLILPKDIDDRAAIYPCRRMVHSSPNYNAHLLCDGTSFREMHLMDKPGIPVSPDIDFMSSNSITASFFLSCTMMVFHKTFIPKYASLFPAVTEAVAREKLESALHRLIYMYAITIFAYWPLPSPDDKKVEPNKSWNPNAIASILLNHYGISGQTSGPETKKSKAAATKMKKKVLRRLTSELELNVGQVQSQENSPKDLDTILATEHRLTEQKGRFLCRSHLLHYSKPFLGDIRKFPTEYFTDYADHVWQLNFLNQEIEELPEDFFRMFPSIGNLNMFKNKLKKFPRGVGNCKNMTVIDIGSNNIEELPDDFSDCAATLSLLQVSYNPLRSLPKNMGKFVQLKQLKASNTLISELPEDIGNMKELKELLLKGNLLSRLPDSFSELTALEKLDLRGIPWVGEIGQKSVFTREAFDAHFESMPALQTIDAKQRHDLFLEVDVDHNGMLTSKEVTALNARIFMMFPRLGRNDTADSEYGGVPSVLCNLSNLKMLKLDYQAIRKVPSHIKGMTSLDNLSVEHNPVLESLAAELGNLPLKALHLQFCPNLRTPPKEIVIRGFGPTYAYLKRLLSGSVECKRTKLMMVGLGGAGKTSLVRALTSGKFHTRSTHGEQITDGIDISSWTVKTQDDMLTFSVWDFAGQTVYYNTHQFFLSNRAVYLLLWNTRLGVEHSGLDFWLSSIAVHAPKAPIFVVGTHADQVAKVEVPEAELSKRYPQIAGFFLVSSLTGQGLPDLQAKLLEVTLQEKYMGERIPQVWLNFEKKIIAERKNASLLPWKTVRKMALNVAIYDETEIMQAVQFLHDLGSLQHFDNEYLKDRVVINPQWIVDVMACVVSVHESAIKDGQLQHSDIAEVWSSYDSDLHEWLLRLTEEFDLTFPLTDKPVNVVPCLLPEKEPEFDWPDINNQPGFKETKMLYKFEYLPAGLFNRAQVRLYQFCDSSVIWKKGSMLRKNGHVALMRHLRDSNLLVMVQGPRPENVLFLVHEIFEGLITESFHGVTYDYMVPCPDCINVGSRDPCMFTASKISRANDMKAPFLQCDHYFHTISLHELQAVMPPDSSSNFDVHLENTMRDLEDIRISMTSDVFMLYCHDNLPRNGDNAVDPRKVKDLLEIEGYSCWLNEDQDEGNIEQVTIAMKDAQIVMVFMSNEFERSAACRNQLSYGVNVLHKVVVPVVLGNGMEWQKTHTGMLVSKEVYVNMQGGTSTFKSKMEELLKHVRNKTKKQEGKKYPQCFVSYCWHNSRNAVDLKQVPENPQALGKGDPRELKDYLENHGVSCWMDVDNAGRSGLFEDIAEGLKHADLMIACVSDEYARSKNCQMEFRFACVTLRLPVIIAVVGKGYAWEASEIGMLSLGCHKVNFQNDLTEEADKMAHMHLLDYVKSKLPEREEGDEKDDEETQIKVQKNLEFQELYELAQRKFLRQTALYAESMDTQAYPRLILLDYCNREEEGGGGSQGNGNRETEAGGDAGEKIDEKEEEDRAANAQDGSDAGGDVKDGDGDGRHGNGDDGNQGDNDQHNEEPEGTGKVKENENDEEKGKGPSAVEQEDENPEDRDMEDTKATTAVQSEPNLIAYLLCEHEEGWHHLDQGIPLCVEDSAGFVANMSAYLARILAVVKHGPINLDMANDVQLMKILVEKAAGTSGFSKEYEELRTLVMEADEKSSMGGLQRCQLATGRISWLCTAHQQQQSRITVLSNLISGAGVATEMEDDQGLAEHLQDLMVEQDQMAGSFPDIRDNYDGRASSSGTKGRVSSPSPLPQGQTTPRSQGQVSLHSRAQSTVQETKKDARSSTPTPKAAEVPEKKGDDDKKHVSFKSAGIVAGAAGAANKKPSGSTEQSKACVIL